MQVPYKHEEIGVWEVLKTPTFDELRAEYPLGYLQGSFADAREAAQKEHGRFFGRLRRLNVVPA
jgi:hypothetical protein